MEDPAEIPRTNPLFIILITLSIIIGIAWTGQKFSNENQKNREKEELPTFLQNLLSSE